MATSVEPAVHSMPMDRSSRGRCGMLIVKYPTARTNGAKARYPGGSPFSFPSGTFRALVALLCAVLLLPGELIFLAQPVQQPPAAEAAAKLSNDQLDSLVAPIALLSGPAVGPGACRVHLSSGDHPASAVVGEEQELERQGAGGCREEAELGPEHPGHGRASRCWSSGWRMTSSGPPTWEMLFWRNRAM